jgi:hypothetical protein
MMRSADLRTLGEHTESATRETSPDTYARGYLHGVEDLVNLLTARNPAVSERLVELMLGADLREALPRCYRL